MATIYGRSNAANSITLSDCRTHPSPKESLPLNISANPPPVAMVDPDPLSSAPTKTTSWTTSSDSITDNKRCSARPTKIVSCKNLKELFNKKGKGKVRSAADDADPNVEEAGQARLEISSDEIQRSRHYDDLDHPGAAAFENGKADDQFFFFDPFYYNRYPYNYSPYYFNFITGRSANDKQGKKSPIARRGKDRRRLGKQGPII